MGHRRRVLNEVIDHILLGYKWVNVFRIRSGLYGLKWWNGESLEYGTISFTGWPFGSLTMRPTELLERLHKLWGTQVPGEDDDDEEA